MVIPNNNNKSSSTSKEVNDNNEVNNENNNVQHILSEWNSKKRIFLEDVSSKIRNGSHIYIGNFACTAQATIRSIVDDIRLMDITIIQLYPGGVLPHLEYDNYYNTTRSRRIRTSAYFAFSQTASSVRDGVADYIPAATSRFPRLLTERNSNIDVAIIKVTPPNDYGYVNLGIGIDVTVDILKYAKCIIAEVTSYMPWTYGPYSQISCKDIDWWILQDEPLGTIYDLFPNFTTIDSPRLSDDVYEGIGKHLVKEIPTSNAILQIEFSPFTACVLPYLQQFGKSNIGIHTDTISDTTMNLMKQGIITNSSKSIHTGKTITSLASGSQELYQWLHKNPDVEFYPISYINDPQIIRQMDNVISIMGGMKVDLTGQVATSSVGFKFYGGQGSSIDSFRGATLSKGGKPIIALPSKSSKGYSNIVSALPLGTGVTITRADVEYVVTEYGTAYLFGKTIRERVLALINIAHPEFRQGLFDEAKQHHYIPQEQVGSSLFKIRYPEEWERYYVTKTNKTVFVRPIKATDEDALRDFFHQLSDHSIYMRYFRKVRSLPQRILRKTTDIDYSTNMAIIALYPPDTVKGEIIALGQWIADTTTTTNNNNTENKGNDTPPPTTTTTNPPEIAFQVRDDWQGNGLGKHFFLRLAEISKVYGVSHFKADVLADNKGMNYIFQHTGIPYTKTSDFGVFTYTFDLGTTTQQLQDEILYNGPFAGPN